MKSKKLGCAIIGIIILLSVPALAFGGSGDYLVPVTIKKTDRAEIKGYLVLHGDEILRMGSGTSSRRGEERHRMVLWGSQRGGKDPSGLLEFQSIRFTEGGHEVFISYGHGKHTVATNNFFSSKGIQFTPGASNLDILPKFLDPGKILWIERTGRPQKIK